ncbi:MAG TPA: hypothetical protein VFG50_16495 [Rhodothermales bacterium]|nr:hypothetical protein [Rhodothermales bacterium]
MRPEPEDERIDVPVRKPASQNPPHRSKGATWYGWAGLLLIAIAWPLNWFLPGLRTQILFFPLWFGYILAVDRMVYARRGGSLLNHSAKRFAALFLISAPIWWVFEAINARTHNWQYLGREHFSDLAYVILASISFSTVMPAVFETADLIGTGRWVRRIGSGLRIPRTNRTALVLFCLGVAMLAALLIWPTYFYALTWGALFALIEPLNIWLGRRSIFDHLQFGDWRPLVALSAGALICGFFWEMWNYYSYPQWIYHTPGVDFLHVFKMPLVGYIGYLPFAWELYAVDNLVQRRPETCLLSFEQYGPPAP